MTTTEIHRAEASPSAAAVDAPTKVEQEALSLPEALARCAELLRKEQVDEAEALARAMLSHWPEQPDALHFHGLALHALGEVDAGIAEVRRAIALMPREPGPCNNLGNLLVLSGRPDEAADAYRQCLDRDPGFVAAVSNLGALLRKRGQLVEAEAQCRRAVALKPDFGDAWYMLSVVLIEQGQIAEGLQAHSRAIALWPRHLLARDAVLRALAILGELDQAAVLYREWLAEDPDNPVLLHQLAACTQGDVPPRASDGCIELIFDNFASSFDAKLGQLGYRAPPLVVDALTPMWDAPARQYDVVDVGCGTGLVGPLVRDWARTLAGCDLSVGMLRQAKQRGCYDVLHKAELMYYLETQPNAFDGVVSADTLCYFGDLHGAARAAAIALRAGGVFVFTVEALGEGIAAPHRLQANGRYAHAHAHVVTAIEAAGLRVVRIAEENLRMEAGKPVRGWLAVAQRPEAH